MVFKSNFAHNFTFHVSNGAETDSNGTILDISGIGADLSGTTMLKIAPIDNAYSFYTLLDLSGNNITKADCSGFNIIRVANGTILGVGYISNPSSVNAFTCDTSGNLWVGGNAMNVSRSAQNSVIANTESMFMTPYNTPTLPTAFLNVDVSGCNDICRVRNLMMATVVDVSGICHNWASGTDSSLTVDSTVFPRLTGATAAFNVYTSPQAGGGSAPTGVTKADVSGHRLVAFERTGTNGYDVSGFYIVRQNTSNGNSATASDTTGLASGINPGIKYDISLNKIAFEESRNQLYVGTSNAGANSKLLIVPLDISSNVIATHDISYNALFSYAAPTSTTSGAVDGSGFMFVCRNPTSIGARPQIYLDASGESFDILTLSDVSGVNAMTSVMASNGTSNYNYLYLVDASRNTVGATDTRIKTKIAKLSLSSRNSNDGEYVDGSGVTFLFSNDGSELQSQISSAYVKDIQRDTCGNIFICGHQIKTIIDTQVLSDLSRFNTTLEFNGPSTLYAGIRNAFSVDSTLLQAAWSPKSVTEKAKPIIGVRVTF